MSAWSASVTGLAGGGEPRPQCGRLVRDGGGMQLAVTDGQRTDARSLRWMDRSAAPPRRRRKRVDRYAARAAAEVTRGLEVVGAGPPRPRFHVEVAVERSRRRDRLLQRRSCCEPVVDARRVRLWTRVSDCERLCGILPRLRARHKREKLVGCGYGCRRWTGGKTDGWFRGRSCAQCCAGVRA